MTWLTRGTRGAMSALAAVGALLATTAATAPAGASEPGRRIVGGSPSGVNEFPWMLGLVDKQRSSVYCGASLISSDVALTSVHCLRGRSSSQMMVLAGDFDYASGADTGAARVVGVQGFVTHEQYNEQTGDNDIALLVLDHDLWSGSQCALRKPTGAQGESIGPICLPDSPTAPGTAVIAAGWGVTFYAGPSSTALRKVYLGTVAAEACAKAYPGVSADWSTKLCTYRPSGDFCQGDSGGPLAESVPAVRFDGKDPDDRAVRRYRLAGIQSDIQPSGNGCATTPTPSVSTRVSSYTAWIKAHAPKDTRWPTQR